METPAVSMESVEVWYSPQRMLILAALSASMTLLCLFSVVSSVSMDGFYFVSWFGVLFFGLAVLKSLWDLVSNKAPVLIFSAEGIRDKRYAREIIPWPAIKEVKTWSSRSIEYLVLSVDKEVEQSIGVNQWAKMTRPASNLLGVNGIYIADVGLEMKYPEIFKTTMNYLSVYGRENFRGKS